MTRDLSEQLMPNSRHTLSVSSGGELGYRDEYPILSLSHSYQSNTTSNGLRENATGCSPSRPHWTTSNLEQPIGVQLEEPLPPYGLDISSRDILLLRRLCIVQLAAGVLLIIFNTIGIMMNKTHLFGDTGMQVIAYNVAPGIWTPLIVFSASAAMTILTLHKRTACRLVANLVLSTASSIYAVMLLGFALWATYASSHVKTTLALSVLFTLTSLVEVGVAFWTSAINHRLICGKDALGQLTGDGVPESTTDSRPMTSYRQWALRPAQVTHTPPSRDSSAPVLASSHTWDSIMALPVE